ncbi:MAG: dockerin type I domain-containing protein [Pirellulaceae bacterium]
MKNRTMSRRPASQKQKRRSFFSWLLPTQKEEQHSSRRLRFESLEDRRVLAVTLGANFETSRLFVDSGFIPPDTMAAIGPNHVVEAINGNFQIFDRAGASLETRSLDSFWTARAGATIPSGTFDPRVVFDTASNRWFATSINGGGGNTIFIARSDSADPTGDWDSVQFIGDTINGVRFCDYDTLGLDADGLYIATNNFGGPSGFDVSLFSIPKTDLLAAVPTLANMTRFEAQSSASRGASIQGNLDFGPSDGVATVIGDAGGTLRRSNINGPAAGGATLGASSAITGVPAFAAAPPARQPSGVTIENVSPRFTGNMVKQGNFLWAAHAVQGTAGTNSAVRWYQINEATNAVVQTGLIEDTATPRDFYDPSIAVNQFGIVAIGYTSSGPTQFAGATVSVGTTINGIGGPVTTFAAPLIVQPGAGNYFQDFGSGRNRWGDYSATNVDPANAMSFWTFQEYVAVTNIWGIRATEFNVNSLDIVLPGDGANNNFIIRRDVSGLNVEIIVDGNVTTFPFGSLNSITTNGLGGNDTLTVDFVNGNPSPVAGIAYDGGAEPGTDLLVLRNGSFTTEVSTATGGGSGTIAFSGGALGTASITYAALEPVDDTVAVVNYTFNATAAGEIINIVNGPILAGPTQTTQINSGSGTFELQNIANKTNVTVNALAGDDTFNVNNPAPGVGMATLTVQTNSAATRDTVNVLVTPASVITNVTSDSGQDNVNIGNAGSINGILGVININNPPSASDILIDDSADLVGRTITATAGTITFNGQAAINFVDNDIDNIIVQAGSGADIFNIASTNDNFGTDINTFNGNGGIDIFNYTGSGSGAGSTNNLNGGTGDDTFNVSIPITFTSVVNVDGGPNDTASPGDTLNVDCGGLDVTVNGNNQLTFPGSGNLNYVNIETLVLTNLNSLTVNGDAGNNQHVLTRTAANRFRSLLDGGPAIFFDRPLSAGTQFTFNGLGGDDTETVDQGAAGGLVNLRAAFNGGANSPVGSEVPAPPGDTLIITGNPGSVVARETYLVGATQDAGTWVLDPNNSAGPGVTGLRDGDELVLVFTGLEPVDTDTPAAVFDVILPSGGTNDDLTIDNVGSPLNGFAAVRVLDNAGTFETFRFARKDTTRIMANLNSAGGTDIFRLNYATAPVTATGAAFTLETYGHIAPGVLGQPGDDLGTDQLAVFATAVGTTNSFFGQGGNDTAGGGFILGDANLDDVQGTVNIDGGAGVGDLSHFQDVLTAAGVGDLATLTFNQLTGAAPATINYVNVEGFFYEATPNADTINVLSTALGTTYIVGGDGNSDTFTIGNQTADFNVTFDGSLDAILGRITIWADFNLTDGAADTLNVDDSGTAALNGVASINNLGLTDPLTVGAFNFVDSQATQLLNFAPASIEYAHSSIGGGFGAGERLEFLNVLASTGNDVVNVNATTAVTRTILDTREGNDTVTISGDNLSGANFFRGFGAPSAADGNDDFILNIAVHIGDTGVFPTTSLQIEGNANTAVDSANRDRVTINDNNAGFVRDLTYDYLDTQGDLDILANTAGNGLFGGEGAGLIPVNIRTMETLRFNAAGAANDLVTVSGTSADDVITVAQTPSVAGLSAQSSAFVFLNGNPYITSPGAIAPPDSLAGNFPGVAGGGLGVDMLINGIAPASGAFFPTGGLTLDGSGTSAIGNRAIVQALSETNLLDPVSAGAAVDVFNLGLGAGVLVPGTGVNNAFDLVSMNGAFAFDNDINPGGIASSPNQVLVQNIVSGLLVPVTVVPASFVNGAAPSSRAGLIANGGDEAAARGAGFTLQGQGIADNFFAAQHPLFTLGVNGNLPVFGPLGADGFPAGDQLNLFSPTSFSIWSDKQTPPNVTIMAGNGPFGVIDSSIERTRLFPSNGVVNLIGDQNNPAVDQTDNFVVRGIDIDSGSSSDGGVQEMEVVINGSAPILIEGVNRLNTYGYDLVGQDLNSPFPNAPDAPVTGATADDIDTLEITPFADNAGPNLFGIGNNAPRGWGVGVVFNEGSPAQQDGDQADLLIVHTSIGVNNGLNAFGGGIASEDIVVQPSGPDNGEVRVTSAVDGSVIMVVSYINNTDLIIVDDDGSLSDTDSLTLRGTDPNTVQTSGNETFAVDFDAAGTVAAPMVTVTDTANGSILYRLRSFTDPNGATGPIDTVTFDMLGGNDTLNFRTPISDPFDSLERVNVLGGLGDDAVTVDMDQRDIWHRVAGDGLYYDGGAGIDSLTISGTPAPAAIGNVIYTPGPIPGNGQITHQHPAGVGSPLPQVIDFVSLEPVVDLVPAAVLIVNANNAANAINFASTPGDATRGRVSIDDQEYIDFSNKVTLTINALAGADAINLTIPAAPPTGLTGINVDGGDPSNGDAVNIFTTSAANTVTFTPTSAEGMNVIGLPGLAANVVITNTAAVTYDGNAPAAGVPNDILTISGTAGDDTTNVNPTGIGTATFQSGLSPLLTLRGFTALTANAGTGGFDDLIVTGTNGVDTLTSAANVLTMVGTVTVGANIDRLQVNVLDGNDSVTLTGVTIPTQVTVYGGEGNDSLIGSPNNDIIYGGGGNDVIIGGAGDDFEYGEDGNDIFGNPTVAPNGVADDAGIDNSFGGAGFDNFIWEPGDGADVNSGGEDAEDIFRFFGNAAANVFTLRPGGTPTHFNALIGALVIDNHGIEDVIVDGQGGADTFIVNDLFTTEVVAIVLNLNTADAAKDTVTVQGREVADNVNITAAATTMNITGLKYNISVLNAVAGENDEFVLNGNGGNDVLATSEDSVTVAALTTMFTSTNNPIVPPNAGQTNFFTLNGGQGNDTISGYGRLDGGAGNDILFGGSAAQVVYGGDGNDSVFGGAGDDVLIGGLGDDLFVGGTGADTINGGDTTVANGGAGLVDDGYDVILVQGTSSNDTITANQSADVTVAYTVTPTVGTAVSETDTMVLFGGVRTVEELKIEAGSGDDVIFVTTLDALGVDAIVNTLLINVDGGTHHTRDRLSVQDNGTGDLVLYRKAESDTAGTVSVGPGNAESIENVFTNVEFMQPVTTGTVLVFKHDPYEWNDNRLNATYLGSDETINVDPNIDPGPLTPGPGGAFQPLPGDVDYYRVVAEKTGTLDFQVYFTEIPSVGARPGLPSNGNLDIQVQDAAGNVIAASFGGNDGTGTNPELDTAPLANERVRIPAVAGQTYYLRVTAAAANAGIAINTYNVTVVNTAAPVPFDIELLDAPVNTTTNATAGAPGATAAGLSSDTGRSQRDNITFDNDPTILIRVPDVVQIAGSTFLADLPLNGGAPGNPPDEVIRIPFVPSTALNANASGFRVVVFVTEINTGVAVVAGYAQPIVGQPGTFTFTFANDALAPDGSYYISSRVEMIDPTSGGADTGLNQGFGAFAESLEVNVDTILPTAVFGTAASATDGLHPDSDTGVLNSPASNADRITYDTTPTFWGVAEADTVVRLYADLNNNGAVDAADVQIATTVTLPYDGTNQYPNGAWEATAFVDLNNPAFFPVRDGVRTILLTAEDVAGNIVGTTTAITLQVFVDTQGPQITDVDINNAGNPYDLFDPKPSTDGPTPLVNSLVISVRDLPARAAGFLYDALNSGVASSPGMYQVRGDYNGIIPISSIVVVNNAAIAGSFATATIQLNFAKPLPDDRFTLTILDGVVDPVGNNLDGESNVSEPQEFPSFPSGNGVPGGNFVARFTVDTRPEVGTWGAGAAWIDTNGNTTFDQNNADYTNRDITYYMGYTSDNLFAGNFVKASGGTADGFDKLAAYGKVGGSWRFLVDVDNDGAITPGVDIAVVDPAAINGVPVAGNFDGNALNGDEVGVFTGTTWYFDTNHDFKLDLGSALAWGVNGYPVVGNYDGVGGDDLATYKDNVFSIDLGRNGTIDRTFRFGFPTPNNRPVSADMDKDGCDDLGLFVPNRAGVSPQEDAEWYILVSGGASLISRIHADPIDGVPVIDYTPVPFGDDIYIQYGDEFGLPILGNFDPPVTTPVGGGSSGIFPHSNPRDPLDVNNDGSITPIDALLVINEINTNGSHALDISGFHGTPFIDTDRDNVVSPHDVLLVINKLNTPPAGSPGAEGEADAPASAHDAIFSQLGGTIAPAASSSDNGIISLLADDQLRIKRSRQSE